MHRRRILVVGTALFLVALLPNLAGCAQERSFSFAVAADMRGDTPPERPGPRYFQGACEALQAVGPGAFMISPGDVDPPGRVRATLDAVFGPDYVWYPVIGNHEVEQAAHMEYLRAYNAGGNKLPGIVRSGPPGAVETCYSFDYQSAHFVVLNQYYDGASDSATDGDTPPPLYDWLAADLAANRKPIVLVFGHEPSVSLPDLDNGRVRHRGDSLDANEATNQRFWALLRDHHVTAYVCGHTHDTSLAKINGVWQIDAGHARGYGDEGTPSTFMKFFVEPGGVRCDVYRLNLKTGQYGLTYSEWLR